MSEPFPRSRQDMGGYDAQNDRYGASHEDPLAELARVVGKDDPFRAGGRGQASNVARFPQVAQRPGVDEFPAEHEDFNDFDAHDPHGFEPQLRGSIDARNHHPAHDDLRFAPAGNDVEAFEPALGYPAASGRAEAPPLNADLWAEGALPQSGPTGDLFQDHPQQADDHRGPRRTLIVLAAVVALTAGGLGATFLMHDGSGVHLGSGAPPTIMAADTPVKVQSPDMTNGSTPDGNTALLEKTGSDKVDNAKVVANNEQPVDLNQLPKTASGQADAPAQTGASPSPFPEPRKVKTVMIRPDGSVVGQAQQAAAAPAQPVGMVLPTEAGGPVEQAQPTGTVAKPSTPKSTARASITPTSPAAGASGVKAAASPTSRPAKPVAVAAADDTAPTPATAPGTWSVQLGAPPSEQEAKDMSARLQKKFSGELGGLRPGIVKADKDGKPIYRVRVGSLAQADAKALCTKLQGSGGSCFVVRN